MKSTPAVQALSLFSIPMYLVFCGIAADEPGAASAGKKSSERAQVPTWSSGDLHFFLHGSMSTEFVPETMLRAFVRAYPDLFPSQDLSHLGLIADPRFGWPVGFSRAKVPHLGGLSAVGVNCAVCHVGEVTSAGGGERLRILGVTSHFDAEAFFGSIIVSTFRTAEPANMKRFLAAWLAESDPTGGDTAQELLAKEWQRQETAIAATIAADPSGSKGLAPGALHKIRGSELRLNRKLVAKGLELPTLAHATLKVFHNMRAALHVPDQPPPPSPPNGPGRNDPWRILSYSLLGVVTDPAPVKFGIVWNEDQRTWVHFDGNTRSPIIRNLAAALGLGAPLIGHRGVLDFALVKRQTDLSEHIRPPRYPWAIDRAASGRGAKIYGAHCAACHEGPQTDQRLSSLNELRTDPNRADIFTPKVADGFNQFFAQLQIPGFRPPQPPALRSTGKYWAPGLEGVWARSPYLHNGSVRTLRELLAPPASRAKRFHRGSHVYDADQMGYTDDGTYVLDTTAPGNTNGGHDYATGLSGQEKRDLIEYLKTL